MREDILKKYPGLSIFEKDDEHTYPSRSGYYLVWVDNSWPGIALWDKGEKIWTTNIYTLLPTGQHGVTLYLPIPSIGEINS